MVRWHKNGQNPTKKQLWLTLVPRPLPQKKIQIIMFGNWGWLLSQTTKFISCKFILAVEMSLKAKPDSYFISFSFCDTIILAAISSVPRGDSPWPLQFQQIVQPSHTHTPEKKQLKYVCIKWSHFLILKWVFWRMLRGLYLNSLPYSMSVIHLPSEGMERRRFWEEKQLDDPYEKRKAKKPKSVDITKQLIQDSTDSLMTALNVAHIDNYANPWKLLEIAKGITNWIDRSRTSSFRH